MSFGLESPFKEIDLGLFIHLLKLRRRADSSIVKDVKIQSSACVLKQNPEIAEKTFGFILQYFAAICRQKCIYTTLTLFFETKFTIALEKITQ